MVAALLIIWIGSNILSDGAFLTSRNLWNLSVQTSVVAIMATGMVLVIVSRNIDLSVGSMLAAVGMAMALLQTRYLTDIFEIGSPAIWIIAILGGLLLGALIGALQGTIVAYIGVPSFIVTLGGLLVWRGVAWWMASGQTIAPMDKTFQILGGGARGTIGGTWTWILGFAGCVGDCAAHVEPSQATHSGGLRTETDVGRDHDRRDRDRRDPRRNRGDQLLSDA